MNDNEVKYGVVLIDGNNSGYLMFDNKEAQVISGTEEILAGNCLFWINRTGFELKNSFAKAIHLSALHKTVPEIKAELSGIVTNPENGLLLQAIQAVLAKLWTPIEISPEQPSSSEVKLKGFTFWVHKIGPFDQLIKAKIPSGKWQTMSIKGSGWKISWLSGFIKCHIYHALTQKYFVDSVKMYSTQAAFLLEELKLASMTFAIKAITAGEFENFSEDRFWVFAYGHGRVAIRVPLGRGGEVTLATLRANILNISNATGLVSPLQSLDLKNEKKFLLIKKLKHQQMQSCFYFNLAT